MENCGGKIIKYEWIAKLLGKNSMFSLQCRYIPHPNLASKQNYSYSDPSVYPPSRQGQTGYQPDVQLSGFGLKTHWHWHSISIVSWHSSFIRDEWSSKYPAARPLFQIIVNIWKVKYFLFDWQLDSSTLSLIYVVLLWLMITECWLMTNDWWLMND